MPRARFQVLLLVVVLAWASPVRAQQPTRIVAGGAVSDAIATALAQIATDSPATRTAVEALLAVFESFPPAYASNVAVVISTSGNNQLIPAVAGQVIDVMGCALIARGTVEVQEIYGDTGGALANEVNISGPMLLGVAGTNPPGLVMTLPSFVPAGKAYGLELSAAVEVDGKCTFVQYTP